MKIIKRDGREVPYDYTKIKKAIEAANGEVAEEDRLTDTEVGFIVGRIEKRCADLGRSVGVEEIQDIVIDELEISITANTGYGMSCSESRTARIRRSCLCSGTTTSWQSRRTRTRTRSSTAPCGIIWLVKYLRIFAGGTFSQRT